ncbi:MAG: FAD-dependent oxidoreductase, partial [Gammaproteobacteria bacterium]|nr:FAD-dependent oxidoreductase [Gammaproteobacteria bacterium]
LPWQGRTIAGTTDIAAEPSAHPEPTDEEVAYLLGQLGEWLEPAPAAGDIHARWAGLRPLIEEQAANTASIVREHHVEVGPKGLVSIAGGKWTTYRLMAEETVDRLVQVAQLEARNGCRTRELALVGAEGFHEQLADELAAQHWLDADVADHLARAYGDRARELLAAGGGAGTRRLAADYPYIEAEVGWVRDYEMALTAEDVLARRLRLAFLDQAATAAAMPRVEALLEEQQVTGSN